MRDGGRRGGGFPRWGIVIGKAELEPRKYLRGLSESRGAGTSRALARLISFDGFGIDVSMVDVNTKTSERQKNAGGRPSGRSQDRSFAMRANAEFFQALDAWRKGQPDLPNRSEAIRRLVDQALKRA